jgi:23S rRNA-/tRNA-specific pseudouridylate synthase
VGDKLYGRRRESARSEVKAERQLLHGWALGLFHPKGPIHG